MSEMGIAGWKYCSPKPLPKISAISPVLPCAADMHRTILEAQRLGAHVSGLSHRDTPIRDVSLLQASMSRELVY